MIKPTIIQSPISERHLSAVFFDGLVANGKTASGKHYVLCTEGSNEICLDDIYYCGSQIRELGIQNEIDDNDLEFEADILVDCYLVIAEILPDGCIEKLLEAEDQDEDRIFAEYGEAIHAFEEFLNKN